MGVGRDGTAGPAWFWEIVERCRGASPTPDGQVAALEECLAKIAPHEIVQFDKLLGDRLRESNRTSLWGAAALINGGCSDDGFLYFCGWLILQGEQRFKSAIKDPDSIADWLDLEALPEGVAECEDLLYVAQKAHERATGEDIPTMNWGKLGDPEGEPFEEEGLARKYPKLAKIV